MLLIWHGLDGFDMNGFSSNCRGFPKKNHDTPKISNTYKVPDILFYFKTF